VPGVQAPFQGEERWGDEDGQRDRRESIKKKTVLMNKWQLDAIPKPKRSMGRAAIIDSHVWFSDFSRHKKRPDAVRG